MRHLISPLDFSVEETDRLLSLASDIEKKPFPLRPCMRRKKAGDIIL